MRLGKIRNFMLGTLRGRLILGVASIHAVMMTLFIVDLTVRQRALLLDRQADEATALAQSLSTSAAVWIKSDDISGLQELIESQRLYPELQYAILTDERGLILAHTDHEKQGLYLLGLPNKIHDTILIKTPALVDIVVPAQLNNRHIGWVRVGIGSKKIGEKLSHIIYTGILYAFFAIVIGSLIAWFMGRRITRRLYAVQDTINKVRTGNSTARSNIEGSDEAASIAAEFNIMLDTLGSQYTLLSALINSPSDIVIFSLDKEYCYTAFNEKHRSEMKKVWKVDIKIGMNLLECMQIKELRELAKQSMDRALNGEAFSEIQHQPEPDIYYEFSWNPIFQNKEIVGITAFVRDITKQKQNEIQIIKLNRIYSVLSNINEAIVRIHEPEEMMKEACRIAVEYGKFQMAWIGMVNTQSKKVDVVASYGDTGNYLQEINIDLSDEKRNNGPTGIAVKTSKHKISNNIVIDDSMAPWRNNALKYDYKSSASFPLIVNEKAIGAFNLYSDEVDFFQEGDIKLLDEMAIDISFAFEFIQAETNRKQAEKALKESEQKYRSLIQKIQTAIIVHGGNTQIITCNVKAQELLGLTEDQLWGKTAIDPAWHFFREDMSIMPLEEYPVNRVMASRQVLRNYIVGIHRPNNENDVWVLVNADPVFDEKDEIKQVIVTFIDITERKEAEEVLHKALKEIQDLYNNAPCGYHSLDKDGVFVKINKTELEWLGYSYEEVIGRMKFTDLLTEEGVKTFRENFPRFKIVGELRNLEFELIRKNGSILPILVSATAITDNEGNYLMSRSTVIDITEHKKSQEAIQESKKHYYQIVDLSQDMIVIHQYGKVVFINDAGVKLAGASNPDQIIGRSVLEFVPLKQREIAQKRMQADLVEGESSEVYEQKLLCLDGTEIDIELRGMQINYQGEKAIQFVARDITERKKVEEALRTAKILLEQTIMQSPVPMVLVTMPDATIRYVNPSARQFLGIDDEPDLTNTPLMNLKISFRDFDLQGNEGFLEELPLVRSLKGIKTEGEERYILRKDGTIRYELVSGTPILDNNGQIIAGYLIMMDITERKQAENALIKSEVGLKEAQRLGRLGSWDWDALTDTIIWSEEYYRIYGFDPTQHPPGYIDHLKAYTPESAALLDEAVKKNMETGEPYVLDLELARADGTRCWITARSETKRNQKGKIIGLRGTAQDITDRKQSEEEIRKLNQELEKRVFERTSQLEAANKELEAFSYSVSHDLRTPLRSIDGFSQAILEDYSNMIDAQGKDYLHRIRSATQRMAQLIDDMLNLSRVSRNELIIQQVNMSNIAQEIAINLKETEPDRQVEFIVHEGIEVQGDSRLLLIVMENLIANAWKFTSKHPTARIEFGTRQQNDTAVYFVRDDGAGFNMKYAQKLFGVFQRLHTTIEYPGTGVGLATVQRIIHRHGGKVWAEGEVEKGTTFYFTIP
ncbi:MAG: PAS domain S-box protein [Bacteroidales bacterium]|nr:PAS domain S-box protein [Bacteroidales bacterium]